MDAMRAAEGLAELLARENAALAAMDLPSATALIEAKRAAADAFVAAQAKAAAKGAMSAGAVPVPDVVRRLGDLAAENRLLLERAMAVQQRVLAIIAEAAPRASAVAPRYGAAGGLVGARTALPVAIAASA
jgi:hypothetical protein